METQKPDKRIVSKGQYAKVQAERATNGLIGGCVWGAALLCALFAIGCCFGFLALLAAGEFGSVAICLLWAVIAGGGAYVLYVFGSILMKDAVNMDPGVPLTRATTGDLPAPDSLVRASQEPVQEQQAMLLRAAAEGQETPPEQMVRAVGGQE